MKSICTHPDWREGGHLPAGRYCTQCGSRVDRRGSAVDAALDARARAQAAARQHERTRLELFARTREPRT